MNIDTRMIVVMATVAVIAIVAYMLVTPNGPTPVSTAPVPAATTTAPAPATTPPPADKSTPPPAPPAP